MEAAAMFADGMTRAVVARHFDGDWRTANKWFKAWQAGGTEALVSKGKPGPAPTFDDEHRAQLADLLKAGVRAYGYVNKL